MPFYTLKINMLYQSMQILHSPADALYKVDAESA